MDNNNCTLIVFNWQNMDIYFAVLFLLHLICSFWDEGKWKRKLQLTYYKRSDSTVWHLKVTSRNSLNESHLFMKSIIFIKTECGLVTCYPCASVLVTENQSFPHVRAWIVSHVRVHKQSVHRTLGYQRGGGGGYSHVTAGHSPTPPPCHWTVAQKKYITPQTIMILKIKNVLKTIVLSIITIWNSRLFRS